MTVLAMNGAIVARFPHRRSSQVRLEDQERINEFGRLNTRLLEIRDDKSHFKARLFFFS